MERVMRNATNCPSGLHAAAFKENAADIRLEDTRRTLRAGLAARTFFSFWPQLEGRFVVPTIDIPSRQVALGDVCADEELRRDREM